jgi:hypothetical protein
MVILSGRKTIAISKMVLKLEERIEPRMKPSWFRSTAPRNDWKDETYLLPKYQVLSSLEERP